MGSLDAAPPINGESVQVGVILLSGRRLFEEEFFFRRQLSPFSLLLLLLLLRLALLSLFLLTALQLLLSPLFLRLLAALDFLLLTLLRLFLLPTLRFLLLALLGCFLALALRRLLLTLFRLKLLPSLLFLATPLFFLLTALQLLLSSLLFRLLTALDFLLLALLRFRLLATLDFLLLALRGVLLPLFCLKPLASLLLLLLAPPLFFLLTALQLLLSPLLLCLLTALCFLLLELLRFFPSRPLHSLSLLLFRLNLPPLLLLTPPLLFLLASLHILWSASPSRLLLPRLQRIVLAWLLRALLHRLSLLIGWPPPIQIGRTAVRRWPLLAFAISWRSDSPLLCLIALARCVPPLVKRGRLTPPLRRAAGLWGNVCRIAQRVPLVLGRARPPALIGPGRIPLWFDRIAQAAVRSIRTSAVVRRDPPFPLAGLDLLGRRNGPVDRGLGLARLHQPAAQRWRAHLLLRRRPCADLDPGQILFNSGSIDAAGVFAHLLIAVDPLRHHGVRLAAHLGVAVGKSAFVVVKGLGHRQGFE